MRARSRRLFSWTDYRGCWHITRRCSRPASPAGCIGRSVGQTVDDGERTLGQSGKEAHASGRRRDPAVRACAALGIWPCRRSALAPWSRVRDSRGFHAARCQLHRSRRRRQVRLSKCSAGVRAEDRRLNPASAAPGGGWAVECCPTSRCNGRASAAADRHQRARRSHGRSLATHTRATVASS